MSANLDAISRMVAGLRRDDRIPEEAEALVQICLSLAVAVDESPGNAALWREYRQAEASLRAVEALAGSEIDELIAAIRDGSDVSADSRA